MFEGILERILQKVVGEYLDGFNANNLNVGIWAGEIVIQGVRLKKSALLKLGLPLELKYSFIQSLVLKIPWKSLTSSKTEMHLDGVYVVLGKAPEDKWELKDFRIVEKRKKDISQYAQNMLKKYLENVKKEENKKEEEGFVERVILRILDNLEVTIKNIHVRVEEPTYCAGLTMGSFKLTTVNKLGVPEYIDRSKPEFKNEPLRKKLQVNNLGIYNNIGDVSVLKSQELASLIGDRSRLKYLILINLQAKLLQMPKGQTQEPEIRLSMSIQKLDIQLENRQIQEIIYFSENAQKYQKHMKKFNQLQLPQDQKQKLKKEFQVLYGKYYNNNQTFEGEEQTRYQRILESVASDQLYPAVKQVLKEEQLKKVLLEKQTKKIGWFSYGKKDLKEDQKLQIQQFVIDNFSQEIKIFQRPMDYGFIQTTIFLTQANIFVGKRESKFFQGVLLKLNDLQVDLKKRQKGMDVRVTLTDMKIDLVQNNFVTKQSETTNFFRKQESDQQAKYISLLFSSFPSKETYLDSKVTGVIQPSIIHYSPVFVKRITEFASLNINSQNKDAAFEKLNQIKDKTAEAIDNTIIQKRQIPVIQVDVCINGPLILIPFVKNYQKYCWGVGMGQLRLLTDRTIINANMDREKLVSQKYLLRLDNLNAGWYSDKDLLLKQYKKKAITMEHEVIIKDFEIDLCLQLSKKNQTVEDAAVSITAELPAIQLNVSEFTYKMIFGLTEGEEKKPQIGPVSTFASKNSPGSKEEVLNNSQKKDIVYHRNKSSMLWSKYIGVVKGSYLYLFQGRDSETYELYVYLKDTTIQKQDEAVCGRANSIRVTNKVSDQILSFTKEQSLNDWIKLIQDKKTVEFVEKKVVESKANPNKLKVMLMFSIHSIGLKFSTEQDNQWMDVSFQNFTIRLGLFQYRKEIALSLKGMLFNDRLEKYLNPSAQYLIKTAQKDGEFVSVKILQLEEKDPGYHNVVNDVHVKIGLIFVNLKPPVIRKVLNFFVPEKPQQKDKLQLSQSTISTEISAQETAVYQSSDNGKLFVKLKFEFEEINLSLINTNTKVQLTTISVKNLNLEIDKSLPKLFLKVSLADVQVTEETNFPNTIISETEKPQMSYLVRTQNTTNKELLSIELQMLSNKNEQGKDILVQITIKDLMVNYFQQPVLRIVDFILLDFLPSLEKSSSPSKPQQVKPESFEQPSPSTIQISIQVLNSVVQLKPNPGSKESLKLQVSKVTVKNSSASSSQYGIEKVLLEDYTIQVSDVRMLRDVKEITNNMNISLKVHLVQNPFYYKKNFKGKFKPEMRIECTATPFLARIERQGFNFLMKCVNHNIAYSDNCDQFFYPRKGEALRIIEQNKTEIVQSDPIKFDLLIEAITLVVAEQVFPSSNLAIKDLKVQFRGFPTESEVRISINNISGSYFEQKSGKYSLIPMINTSPFAKEVIYQKDQLLQLNNLVDLFHHMSDSLNQKDDLVVKVFMKNGGSKIIHVQLSGLSVDLKLRPLLKISKIVNFDLETQTPQSKYKPPAITTSSIGRIQKLQHERAITQIGVTISNLKVRGGGADSRRQAIMITIESINVNTVGKPQLTPKEVKDQMGENKIGISASNMQVEVKGFEICLVQISENTKQKKRTLLQPMSVMLNKNGSYSVVEDNYLLSDDVQLFISNIVLEATTRDLLKLNALYSTNMAIFQEESKDKPKVEPHNQVQLEKSVQRSSTAKILEQVSNQKQLIRDLKASVQIKSLNVKVLHHSEQLVLPVLMFNIYQMNPIYRSNLLVNQFSLIMHIEFNFFNPRCSYWEPIIQKFGLHLQHVVTHKDTGDESLIIIQNLDQVGFEQINLNVSSQFLTSLKQIISLNKAQKQKIQKNELEDQKVEVSPFVVQNMTMIDIGLLTDNEHKGQKVDTTIKSREKKPIVVPLQSTELILVINNKQYTINVTNIGKRMIQQTDYIVDCKVEKLYKVIIITSNTIIENRTSKILFVQPQNSQVVQVNPKQHVSFDQCFEIKLGHGQGQLSEFVNVQTMGIKNDVPFKHGKLFVKVGKEQYTLQNKKMTIISVCAPIKLINNMPYSMLYQVIINNETKATKSLQTMKEYEIFKHKQGAEVSLKINLPGFYWSHAINLFGLGDEHSKLEKVELKDQDLNESLINMFIQVQPKSEAMEVIFFSSGYIVNDTPFDFYCYGLFRDIESKNKKTFYPLAGQQQIQSGQTKDASTIVFGPDLGKKIKFAHRESPKEMSEQIEVAGIGNTEFEIVIKQKIKDKVVDTFMTCIVSRSLKTMMKTTSIQKQVRITPKHIVQNKTLRTIYISQDGSDNVFEVPKETRKILHFFVKKNRTVQIKTSNSEKSCNLEVDNFGVVNFYVISEGNRKDNYQMHISNVEDYTYILFNVLEQKNIPYRIKNNAKGIHVKPSIIDGPVEYGEEVAFLWKDPSKSHVFNLQLTHEKTPEKTETLEINPDSVTSTWRATFKLKDSLVYLRVFIEMNDDKKVVTIQQSSVQNSEAPNVARVLSTLNVSFKKFGVSLMMNHSSILKPYEAIFISFYQLQFIKQTTQDDDTYQGRIKFFQIDQNHPHLMAYPVILTPQKFKQYMGKNKEEQRYLVNFLVRMDTKVKHSTLIKSIIIDINNISIKISQLFIRLLLEVFSKFQEVMSEKEEFMIEKAKDKWKEFGVKKEDKPVFIQEIVISPFNIQLSLRLKQRNSEKSKMKLPFQNLISAFGVNMINIDEAPIHLRGITIQNCYDSVDGIRSKIIQNYKWGVLSQFYKLLGSVDIIGNPVGLFKNISTGLVDMIEKPAQGLVKGPLELGRGIAEGGYSLIAHTIGGALNSLDKMTGALSTGLAFLCFDPEFEEKRQKQKNKKPKNLIQGLEKGAIAIFSGFKQGITGIFLKPYQNAEKDGFLGFLKGTYQGLSGAVIKPVTGILDFASKTTQGLKNTVLFFEDKPNQSRMRCPRPFYGQNSLLKQYNPLDAQILNVLQFVKKGKFSECKFINVFIIEKTVQAIVVVDKYVLSLSFQKKKVLWYIQMSNIIKVQRSSDMSLQLVLHNQSKHLKKKQITLESSDSNQVKQMVHTIEQRLNKMNCYLEQATA